MSTSAYVRVRPMPVDVVCSQCGATHRNACLIMVNGRMRAQSFVCDTCLATLPYRIKRVP